MPSELLLLRCSGTWQDTGVFSTVGLCKLLIQMLAPIGPRIRLPFSTLTDVLPTQFGQA